MFWAEFTFGESFLKNHWKFVNICVKNFLLKKCFCYKKVLLESFWSLLSDFVRRRLKIQIMEGNPVREKYFRNDVLRLKVMKLTKGPASSVPPLCLIKSLLKLLFQVKGPRKLTNKNSNWSLSGAGAAKAAWIQATMTKKTIALKFIFRSRNCVKNCWSSIPVAQLLYRKLWMKIIDGARDEARHVLSYQLLVFKIRFPYSLYLA